MNAARPLPEASTLDVFLNNRCNLACADCCVSTARRPGEGRRLDWPTLRGALDYFAERVVSPQPKRVMFMGGEPLLDAGLLARAVEHARGRPGPPPPAVDVFTNGTLLTPSLYGRLRAAGATVVVSLDGRAPANDRFRRFRRGAGRSVFAEVERRLAGLERDALALNVVVRPEAVASLLGDLRWFRAQGLGQIDLWLDFFSTWDEPALAALARFFVGLRDWCAEEGGVLPFELPMLRHALRHARDRAAGRAWWRDCERLVLGADGSFYDCEVCLAFPYDAARGGAVGDPARGVDWEARASYLERSRAALAELGAEGSWQHVCPRVYYRVAAETGRALAPMVEDLHRVSEVFLKGLLTVAGAQRAGRARGA